MSMLQQLPTIPPLAANTSMESLESQDAIDLSFDVDMLLNGSVFLDLDHYPK